MVPSHPFKHVAQPERAYRESAFFEGENHLSYWLQQVDLKRSQTCHMPDTSDSMACITFFTYVNTLGFGSQDSVPDSLVGYCLTLFSPSHRFPAIPHRWPMRPGPRGRGSASPRVSRTGAFVVGHFSVGAPGRIGWHV